MLETLSVVVTRTIFKPSTDFIIMEGQGQHITKGWMGWAPPKFNSLIA
jgi:hypothetical protein